MQLLEMLGQIQLSRSISTDSRTLQAGDIFVAIVGERFDGHDFIGEAVEKGAAALLVSRPVTVATTIPVVLVPDTVLALGQLATHWRKQFHLPVIGVTGSCGKTTVKTMIGAILEQMGPACVSQGNFNNAIGAPLNVLTLNSSHQTAVFELGASAVGEIALLAQIIQPNIAVLTGIAPAHLKGFGSIENVVQAKGELYEALAGKGTAILNLLDPYVGEWQQRAQGCNLISVAFDTPTADFYASDIVSEPLLHHFKLHTPIGVTPITLHIPGKHSIMNAMLAAAAAFAAGASLHHIQEGLKGVRAVKGRLQVFAGPRGMRIIDDSYNANPGSAKAALEVLQQFEGERVFVLGNMLELGPQERAFHRELGVIAKQLGIDTIMTIGDLAHCALEGFGDKGQSFETMADLIATLEKAAHQKMTMLVKGSRSSGMDRVVRALAKEVE